MPIKYIFRVEGHGHASELHFDDIDDFIAAPPALQKRLKEEVEELED